MFNVGALVSAVIGGVLALGAAFGLVSSQTAVPPAADVPYITYDS